MARAQPTRRPAMAPLKSALNISAPMHAPPVSPWNKAPQRSDTGFSVQSTRSNDSTNTRRPFTGFRAYQRTDSLRPEDKKDISETPSISWRGSAIEKFLLFLATVLPLVLSLLLLIQNLTNYEITGPVLEFVNNDRATTQIVVSIIAAMFANLNLFTLTTLLNLATRLHLLRRSLSLVKIKFLGAVTTRRWGNGLPLKWFLLACLLILAFGIPNILWTGAMTPVITTLGSTSTNALRIPKFSQESNQTWSNNNLELRENCTTIPNKYGVWSNCPVSTLQANLLTRASQATTNKTFVHPKNDLSHYNYVGRSYGVGASAGLFDDELMPGSARHHAPALQSYNYTEVGYQTRVNCSFNSSMLYGFQLVNEGSNPHGIPSVFYARGYAPNANTSAGPDFFSVVGFTQDDLAVVAAKRHAGRNMVITVAGKSYPMLNGSQCDVHFEPAVFDVFVDRASKMVHVRPSANHTAAADFDAQGGLANTLIEQMNNLGMISTSLYTSTVGDALMANVNSTTRPFGPGSFEALANSYEVMFDDMLAFISGSQMFVPNDGQGDAQMTAVSLHVQAVTFGDLTYIALTFAMCVVVLLVFVFEALRTAAWRWLPRWDVTDSTCLILAGAVAGPDLLRSLPRFDAPDGESESLAYWNGDGRESLAGVRLRLGQKTVDDDERGPDCERVPLTAMAFYTKSARNVVRLGKIDVVPSESNV